jgi:hypothetical protein
MALAQRKIEAFPEGARSYPRLIPTVPFGAKERKDVTLLVKLLLRREGLAANVRCTPDGLSITLSGMPLEFGSGGILNLLSVVMAVGHHLEDVHHLESGFDLEIDFWANGRMATTLGKATSFARRMKSGGVTPAEFWKAFDFRLGSR